jgi:N-acetylmuramoyl-L-alanine amidase
VLKATSMTAILCECGFMTNKAEAGLLRTSDYRNRCAEAIVKGIVSYYNLNRKRIVENPSHENDFFKVQVGAFTEKENALKIAEELKRKGYEAIIVTS